MSNEEANVQILKAAYEEWDATKGGSVQHWLDLMLEDVTLSSVAEGAQGLEFTETRSGREAAAEYFAGLVSQLEMIHYTVDEYFSAGDRVVSVGSTAWKNKATGQEFETPKIDVVRFQNGRIAETFELYDTAKVLAAAGPDLRTTIENSYAARRAEDVAAVMSYFHEDIVFRIVAGPELGDLSKTVRGLAELRPAIKAFCATWNWSGIPITDIIIEGDKAAVHSTGVLKHTPTGTDFEYEILDKLTFKDGKIVEFVEFLDTHRLSGVLTGDG